MTAVTAVAGKPLHALPSDLILGELRVLLVGSGNQHTVQYTHVILLFLGRSCTQKCSMKDFIDLSFFFQKLWSFQKVIDSLKAAVARKALFEGIKCTN